LVTIFDRFQPIAIVTSEYAFRRGAPTVSRYLSHRAELYNFGDGLYRRERQKA
jgi:hypothetical protein